MPAPPVYPPLDLIGLFVRPFGLRPVGDSTHLPLFDYPKYHYTHFAYKNHHSLYS